MGLEQMGLEQMGPKLGPEGVMHLIRAHWVPSGASRARVLPP